MYGHFEYGVIPYGDSYVKIIIITVGNVDVIFIADRRAGLFLSEKKIDLFASYDPHTTVVASPKRETPFVSLNKKSTFITDEKSGKRC